MPKKDTIKIYLRIRPSNNVSNNFTVDKGFDDDKVSFHMDKLNQGYINNTKENWKFKFNRIYLPETKQEDIFEGIAKDVADNVLAGYNGTIFAYGQTGSGKTFTITGGDASYHHRGIIPRSIAYIYEQLAKQTGLEWTTRISYLQIYNEKGSDLLNRGQDAKTLDELPKVTIHEDSDEVVLHGLDMHIAKSTEDALSLLFLGDTNRMCCETPMNQTSTRSHCIFTVAIEAKQPGSTVVRRSKLHLVDLAGSERVGKTGVEGNLLTEARYINLSLHYLEQVIVALQEKMEGKRDHIPYRNSMMTQVLRDSLGGNCKTVMIATAHSQDTFMDETISTCRFAMRVASIQQDAKINEETDPKLLVKKLRAEIAELKDELAFYKKGDQSDDRVLSIDEVEKCKALVKEYLDNADPDAKLSGLQGDMSRMMFCYRLMKEQIKDTLANNPSSSKRTQPAVDSQQILDLQEQNRTLQLNLQQKDNEILLLLDIINKSKDGQQPISLPPQFQHNTNNNITTSQQLTNGPRPGGGGAPVGGGGSSTTNGVGSGGIGGIGGVGVGGGGDIASTYERVQQAAAVNPEALAGVDVSSEDLKERTLAYDAFRRSYRKAEQIDKSKIEMRELYSAAKQGAADLNGCGAEISQVKNAIQALRAERALQSVQEEDPEEKELVRKLTTLKSQFRVNADALKKMKAKIEHYHLMLNQAQKQMLKDFENWYAHVNKNPTTETG
eukprot:TRINITY_DN4054_c0_g1_i1.p1 TRINITY_DN4054_c0_g1~~TRINITY_DN4054_c0_g1_i1.p1  ORF type:complete len:723 (+),score=70.71 TRINITY_DN4054_c0_g1_i1:34-2202(+)